MTSMKEIRTAMGFIETIGLVPAIAAADAALKAANVTLIGREISKGSGMVTVKLSGNVGSVNAGLAAGVAEANRIGKVVSAIVIARPAAGFAPIMSYNSETMAVEDWLKAIGSDQQPGKVLTVEGKISEGTLDVWQVKKRKKQERENAQKKTELQQTVPEAKADDTSATATVRKAEPEKKASSPSKRKTAAKKRSTASSGTTTKKTTTRKRTTRKPKNEPEKEN
jgi:microcompartment protein CcmL/EutN